MKRIFKLLLYAVLLPFMTCCASSDGGTVNIGVIAPMTGAGAVTVDYWKSGLDMAVEIINSNQTKKYELLYEDCQSNPTVATACFKRLEMKGVKYFIVLGGQFAMAVAPMTKGKDMLLFTSSDYNESVLDVTDCAFRVYPSARNLGTTASEFMFEECGVRNAASVIINTVPNLMANEVFCAHFSEMGGKVTFQDTFDIGTFDFKNTISKMAQNQVDGIYLTGFGISPSAFCSQISSYSQYDNAVFFGDVNFSTRSFMENKKNDKVKIYYADAVISDTFREAFFQKYGFQTNSMASCAYLIPFLIDDARSSVRNVGDIKSQKEHLRNYTFINEVSDIHFDEKGNGEIEMRVQKIQ